ncbi:hypothetical protein HK105_201602 [Polyrhizophydium stewartii]|uniref:Uncharacterized protein n=1 Tax=Polyrhizophydium stewartii TaxID=2732419 RepID=A0ABR4NGV3_9FUNG|nr:hypothetical protein HK105_001295 [Polyrhizophydium stewartii]
MNDFELDETEELALAADPASLPTARWQWARGCKQDGSVLDVDAVVLETAPVPERPAQAGSAAKATSWPVQPDTPLVAQVFVLSFRKDPLGSAREETLSVCPVFRLSDRVLLAQTAAVLSEREIRSWTQSLLDHAITRGVPTVGLSLSASDAAHAAAVRSIAESGGTLISLDAARLFETTPAMLDSPSGMYV